ncbi:MAG: FAD:protein FMN transferase ApbE [Proteobacteria bacterium]|nr:MAG: FAD:protein FMN transferase ApbE [Pseudomonadota bacterium]
MLVKAVISLFCLVMSVFAGCSSSQDRQMYHLTGSVMGTTYNIKIVTSRSVKPGGKELQQIEADAIHAMNQVDSLMSTYKVDSELSQFNSAPVNTPFSVSTKTYAVLKAAIGLSELSDGAYDVTVGSLVNLWGFGPDGKPVTVPSAAEIADAGRRAGYSKLQFIGENRSIRKTADIYVDLSSIAKGFAVDSVAEVLEQHGINDYLVEIGGEISAKGQKPGQMDWVLAIESPDSQSRNVHRAVSVKDGALATSGDYRNYYERDGKRFSHTINPKTGMPISHRLASVTVVHDSCMMADGLATLFMVMGVESGYELAVKNNMAVYFIYRKGDGFKTRFTPAFKQYLVD